MVMAPNCGPERHREAGLLPVTLDDAFGLQRFSGGKGRQGLDRQGLATGPRDALDLEGVEEGLDMCRRVPIGRPEQKRRDQVG